jgi:hypothetical protein
MTTARNTAARSRHGRRTDDDPMIDPIMAIAVDPGGEATVLHNNEYYRPLFNPDADTMFGPQFGAQAWENAALEERIEQMEWER